MDCVSIKDLKTKDVPIAVLGVLDRRWEILDYGSFLVVIGRERLDCTSIFMYHLTPLVSIVNFDLFLTPNSSL